MHQPVQQSANLPITAMPWEASPPLSVVTGFKQAVGNIEVTLGYAMYPHAVRLFSLLQMTSQSPPQLWRSHWTSKEAAMDSAMQLAAEGEEYLDSFKAPRRPAEDLDFDDFFEHLYARLNNELH